MGFLFPLLFKLQWSPVHEGKIFALLIAEDFDVFEDFLPCWGPRFESAVMNQFSPEGTEEVLRREVVQAVPLATHAADEVILLQDVLKSRRRVMVSSVEVHEQTQRGPLPRRESATAPW